MEREMYQARRARDQQLNETRKEVEKRKETVDRTERRVRSHIQIYIYFTWYLAMNILFAYLCSSLEDTFKK